jgi:ethanolamine-phosphate cytidylyltransferase
VDYFAHSDDAIKDKDCDDYCKVYKDAGRYKVVKRTEGVSSTDILGKLLALTQDENATGLTGSPSPQKPADKSPTKATNEDQKFEQIEKLPVRAS